MTGHTPAGLGLGAGREFDRIRAMLGDLPREQPGVQVGPGDDAAVLSDGTVLSTDLGIEGIHFRLDWISVTEAGYRTAAAAVSDLAAMAATPVGILVSLGAADGEQAEEFMSGIKSLARDVEAAILGGDLTRSPGPLIADVVSVGRTDRPLLRSGAAPGEEVWLTGHIGAAAAAVALLERGEKVPEILRRAYTAPRPRIREARWLVEAGATAGIDLSDGLSGDASHVAAASGVSIVLNRASLPVHPSLNDPALPNGMRAADLALHGGDDFELLVTVPSGQLEGSVREFSRTFGAALTRVGRVAEGSGVFLDSGSGSPVRLARGGYDHFRVESDS